MGIYRDRAVRWLVARTASEAAGQCERWPFSSPLGAHGWPAGRDVLGADVMMMKLILSVTAGACRSRARASAGGHRRPWPQVEIAMSRREDPRGLAHRPWWQGDIAGSLNRIAELARDSATASLVRPWDDQVLPDGGLAAESRRDVEPAGGPSTRASRRPAFVLNASPAIPDPP